MVLENTRTVPVILMTLVLASGSLGLAQEGPAGVPGEGPAASAVTPAAPEPVRFQVVDGFLVAHLPAEKVTVVAEPAGRAAVGEDRGWANWGQRGELLWRGKMEDSQGRSYNVRILPGYVAPGQHLVEGWSDAGSALGEYGESATWNRLGRHARSSLRWGWEDAFLDFGIHGSGKAWTQHFDAAKRRTERKTFGWPLAYPWAVLSSTFETLLRVPLGVVGAAAGTATGVVLVPASHVAWPAVKATWHVGVDGALLPVAGWSWQTLAAPPAALFVSAPTPSRADGTWMTVSGPGLAAAPAPVSPAPTLAEPALASLALYAQETARLAALEAEASQKEREELAALRSRQGETRKALAQARSLQLQAWADQPEHQQALRQLVQEGGDPASLRACRADLIQRLVAAGLSQAQASEAVAALIRHPLRATPPAPARVKAAITPGDKTDPVREALKTVDRVTGTEIIKP